MTGTSFKISCDIVPKDSLLRIRITLIKRKYTGQKHTTNKNISIGKTRKKQKNERKKGERIKIKGK